MIGRHVQVHTSRPAGRRQSRWEMRRAGGEACRYPVNLIGCHVPFRSTNPKNLHAAHAAGLYKLPAAGAHRASYRGGGSATSKKYSTRAHLLGFKPLSNICLCCCVADYLCIFYRVHGFLFPSFPLLPSPFPLLHSMLAMLLLLSLFYLLSHQKHLPGSLLRGPIAEESCQARA